MARSYMHLWQSFYAQYADNVNFTTDGYEMKLSKYAYS